jgi:hypothetical protein
MKLDAESFFVSLKMFTKRSLNIGGALVIACLIGVLGLTPAMAQTIFPTSYDMLNGNNENGAYLDRSYDGSGDPTQPNSFLSGGLGDLADGIIATQNWFDVEPAPPANGPYVGWDSNQPPGPNPTITFNFGCTANIEEVTIYVDDSDGEGGVNPPGSVNISMGGTSLSFGVTDPAGPEPFAATFSGLGLTGTSLSLTLNHSSQWVFLSEVTFEGSCQPVSVEIDIKPGSDPNSINPKSKGNIPVAILTTGDFDATTVDPLSVEFGPDGATESHGRGHIEDVDGDGDDDLVLHFRTQDTGIQCGDTSASLTGETFGGQAIEGSDSINTVGC